MTAKKQVKNERVVRIIVEGPEEAKTDALMGLLRDAEYSQLVKAVSYLAPSQIVRLAQVCHGRLYKLVQY